VFATTEIRKVPITVLSRCQRFDLRRIEGAALVEHLAGIAKRETITVEPDALALIARAAEGSVRDSLSLFDQAIAHAAGTVRAVDVRQMLGLADRARIIDLFDALMRGDIAAALKELRDQYDSGADPTIVLVDLAEFTNFVTRVKIVPSVAEDVSLAEVERTRGREFAASLSMRVLARTWQMLFKGLEEVKEAAKPIAAAEMVLVRIAYAADLPTPDEVIRSLDGGTVARPAAANGGAPAPVPRASGGYSSAAPARAVPASAAPRVASMPEPNTGPVLAIPRFEDLVALAGEKRDLMVKTALERDLRLVRFEDGRLEVALEPGAAKSLAGDLARKISAWTGRRWMVVVSAEQGAPTMRAQTEARTAEIKRGVTADPLVQAVLGRFPGAEIVAVRKSGDSDEDEPTDVPGEGDSAEEP
jgi:DNA polymerase-3 subunit gamma/tau